MATKTKAAPFKRLPPLLEDTKYYTKSPELTVGGTTIHRGELVRITGQRGTHRFLAQCHPKDRRRKGWVDVWHTRRGCTVSVPTKTIKGVKK